MNFLVDGSAEHRLLEGLVEELKTLSGVVVDVQELLAQRVRHTGWRAGPRQSVGGSCHLFETIDRQWVAINLARPEDHELLTIFFEDVKSIGGKIEIASLEIEVRKTTADRLIDFASETGLPVSRLGEMDNAYGPRELPIETELFVKSMVNDRRGQLHVVDLSALWAGPLCSQLLHRAGHRVTKVESIRRPDGARRGHPTFFAELDAGKDHLTFDFDSSQDLAQLRSMIEEADVVIEGSRPRALQQLGFRADVIVRNHRPLVWLSITGYGRQGASGQRVGFGDDCAVAGGLVDWSRSARDGDEPQFVGDAVADPLTGLVAALAILQAVDGQKGRVIEASLAKTAAWVNSVRQSRQFQRD